MGRECVTTIVKKMKVKIVFPYEKFIKLHTLDFDEFTLSHWKGWTCLYHGKRCYTRLCLLKVDRTLNLEEALRLWQGV